MRIFVYGTLKQGFSAHRLMTDNDAKFVTKIKTGKGFALFDQGGFPGMVQKAGEYQVQGEVYEAPTTALKDLDQYECVASGLFKREEILLEDGSKAFAYLYNIEKNRHARSLVESGEWHERE